MEKNAELNSVISQNTSKMHIYHDSPFYFPETSILLTSVPAEEKIQGFSRLYFGNQFCERLIPNEDEIERVLNRISNKNIGFTFVTPFITDAKIKHLTNILEILRNTKPDSEIVINDFGVLNLIKKRFSCFELVCGSLLFRNTIPHSSSYQTPPLNKEFCNNKLKARLRVGNISKPILTSSFLKYLSLLGIRRVEFHNIVDAVNLSEELKESGFKISLYFPFSYLACTRYCYYGSEKEISPRLSLLKCSQECEDRFIILKKRNQQKEIILKWNALFARNTIDLDILKDKIDRLIYVTL